MKVKEVRFEKLFSLEKYNNERIGFVAEVEEGENPDKVVGELHFKILDIEECLEAYRTILNSLEYVQHMFADRQADISRLKQEMGRMKVTIEELVRQAEKGDVDARLRHACERQSYKDLKERLAELQQKLDVLDKQIKELTEVKLQFRERIKQGNFSLEGIEIPEVKPSTYY